MLLNGCELLSMTSSLKDPLTERGKKDWKGERIAQHTRHKCTLRRCQHCWCAQGIWQPKTISCTQILHILALFSSSLALSHTCPAKSCLFFSQKWIPVALKKQTADKCPHTMKTSECTTGFPAGLIRGMYAKLAFLNLTITFVTKQEFGGWHRSHRNSTLQLSCSK